jgi:hypothetical protein
VMVKLKPWIRHSRRTAAMTVPYAGSTLVSLVRHRPLNSQ